MASIHVLVKELEGAMKDNGLMAEHPYVGAWWEELKEKINEEIPDYVRLNINTVYVFRGKRGRDVRAVCTKENPKSYVLYEVAGSETPGTRWMLNKRWCTIENVFRSKDQKYSMPEWVVYK